MIKGAKVIPDVEILDRLAEIPKDKQIIAYCNTGVQAEMAYHKLKEKGYNVKFLNANVKSTRMVSSQSRSNGRPDFAIMPRRKKPPGLFLRKKREPEDYNTLLPWKTCYPQQAMAHANFLFGYARYLGMVQEEVFLTNSMTVISGGARKRMGGPQVPVPRLTCRSDPFPRS